MQQKIQITILLLCQQNIKYVKKDNMMCPLSYQASYMFASYIHQAKKHTDPGSLPSLQCHSNHSDSVHSVVLQCAQYTTDSGRSHDRRDLGHGRRHCYHDTDMAGTSYQAPSGHRSNQPHT